MCGLPGSGASSYDEGGVFGYETHKLEGTWFLVKFLNDGAVEFIVSVDELRDWVWSGDVLHVYLYLYVFFCEIKRVY